MVVTNRNTAVIAVSFVIILCGDMIKNFKVITAKTHPRCVHEISIKDTVSFIKDSCAQATLTVSLKVSSVGKPLPKSKKLPLGSFLLYGSRI
jgi:hypothetical protein